MNKNYETNGFAAKKQALMRFVFGVFGLLCASFPGHAQSSFIDDTLENKEVLANSIDKNTSSFHLFSHGRHGELLINGQWLQPAPLPVWLLAPTMYMLAIRALVIQSKPS